jgi:hypothetical protein
MPQILAVQIDVKLLAVLFLIWTGLWAWLLFKRGPKLSLGKLMIIVSGYAVLAGLAGPTGQWWLIHLQQHPLLIAVLIVGVAAALLWVNSRM